MPAPLPVEDLDQILDQTAPLWEEARGKSFFITGGTGFFGMWLLESFCHINDALGLSANAWVLTRDPAAFARKAPHLVRRSDLVFHQGDIRHFDFPDGSFDYLIHAAAEVASRQEGAADETFDALVSGTHRILQFAAVAGVRKFLLTSSGAAYGAQPAHLTHLPEDWPGAPDPLLNSSAYGEGKRASEHLAAVHARQFGYELKIARCFAFVGPHLPLDSVFAIGNFIRDAMAGSPIRIQGDGTPMRSYLYASDLTVWLWTILFRAPSHRIFNVGSPEDLDIAHLAQIVATTLSSSTRITILGASDPKQSLLRYVPSTERAFLELGLRKTVSLTQGITKTAEWHRSAIVN